MTFTVRNHQEHGTDITTLEVEETGIKVSFLPKFGNTIYSLTKNGYEYLWFPFDSVSDFIQEPRLAGIPLLAPWANRLDRHGFTFGDREYSLNRNLGNYSTDANDLPIHGLLVFEEKWQMGSQQITEDYVEVISKLETWKDQRIMAHFPFASRYRLRYRLYTDRMEVILQVKNVGNQDMPVMVGFHPYFQLPGTSRSDWLVSIPAARRLILDHKNLPTGDFEENDLKGMNKLGDRILDDVYTRLFPEPFKVRSGDRYISVSFSQSFNTAVVYAPDTRDVICFEPMSAPTNAISDENPLLPVIRPQEQFTGSFTITVG